MAGKRRDLAPPASHATRDFRQLVGYEAERAVWARLVARNQLPQVLLVTGREGSGKRLALAALAAMPDCAEGNGCGQCANCLAVIHDAHPEVLWVDGDRDRLGVDEADAVAAHLELSPQAGSRARTVIIPDAERLGGAAANRLLKLFEEPPPAARILLSSSRVRAMLPTVLSRCVRWRLAPPPVDAAVAWLAQRLGASGEQLPSPAMLEAVLGEAGRAPGLALERLRDMKAADLEPRALLRELLHGASSAAVLPLAERLVKSVVGPDGKSVASLTAGTLDSWEVALNAAYRDAWAQRDSEGHRRSLTTWLSPPAIEARRSVLSTARRQVVRGKVPLNAQLTAEALGLAATTHSQR